MITEEAIEAAWKKYRDGALAVRVSKTDFLGGFEAALSTLPIAGGVKEIEWREDAVGDFAADTPFGIYTAWKFSWGWDVEFNGINVSKSDETAEAAKAAAQADFETRILSALTSSPGKDGGQPVTLSFADGIRAAAALFETAPDEPVDDITKLTREAQRQSILSLLKPGGQEVEAVKYEARICQGIPSDCCDYGVVNLEEGIEVCRVWKEDDVRLITDLLNGTVWPEPTEDGDDLTECFRHHVNTTIGWQAFGARPGPEMQMYEEGFKAGYRRCQSDNETEFGEEEDDLDARARKVVGRLRGSLEAGGVEQIDIDNAVDLIVDQAKALARPQPASTALVEAARFLADRLEDFRQKIDDIDDEREFEGHIIPALSRLRAALASQSTSREGER